jgi:hypothetical protein
MKLVKTIFALKFFVRIFELLFWFVREHSGSMTLFCEVMSVITSQDIREHVAIKLSQDLLLLLSQTRSIHTTKLSAINF